MFRRELKGVEAETAAESLNLAYAERGQPRRVEWCPPWTVRGSGAMAGAEGHWWLKCTSCGEAAVGEGHEGGACDRVIPRAAGSVS
jgi:hypothetical protein